MSLATIYTRAKETLEKQVNTPLSTTPTIHKVTPSPNLAKDRCTFSNIAVLTLSSVFDLIFTDCCEQILSLNKSAEKTL